MSEKQYKWQRYWRPRGSSLLWFESGFLFSPGKYNPDSLPFERISDSPCLILLGEPGMGKSFTMKAEREGITRKVREQGDDVLWTDLRSYGDESRLVKALFENQSFENWVTGTHKLHLFLDSFDECQIAIKQLASLLADELEKYQPQAKRLVLRIACRTADWPSLLENALLEIFGNDSVKIYELAPLTREDVGIAATDEGFNPAHFLAEIDRREVGPLAAKPVTLRLLLSLYRSGGVLPTSQIELYERGCLKLAEETSDNYRQTKRLGNLTPAQRLAVASRIAAIMIFGQKSAIWTASDFAEHTPEDITISELCGNVETVDGVSFEIDESAIEETCNTGLFDSRGQNRIGWAHQTYAEFLAARYLAKLNMRKDQILKWFVHPEDAEGKLVPQLHETAAWLAGMNGDLSHELMQREPQLLLKSDVASADVASKATLVEEVLKLYDEEQIFDQDWSRASHYHKLNHPTIADQLRPYIVNAEKNFLVRRAAIEMAEACQVTSLQDEFAALALDIEQPRDLRIYAARAVANIGNDQTKLRLEPLLFGKVSDDPSHRLQSFALQALWPNHVSAEKVFSLFDNPRLNIHFISQDLIEGLKLADLPVALAWIEKQSVRHQMDYSERQLAHKLMWRAWENLDRADILAPFAQAAISRLKKGDAIIDDRDVETDFFSDNPTPPPRFVEQWEANEKKRHLVLSAIVPLIRKDDPSNHYHLFSYHLQSILGRDILWMIEQLQSEKNEEQKLVWANLIKYSCNWHDQEQKLAIIIACQNMPLIIPVFYHEITALHRSLSETSETELMEMAEQAVEEIPEIEPRPHLTQSKYALTLLDEFEAGDAEAWCKLVWAMRFNEDGTQAIDTFKPNLKTYPIWQNADASMQERIIAAARKYLLDENAQTQEWLGKKLIWPPAYAGYNALRLLCDEDPVFVQHLDNQVWKNWASIIVAFIMFGDVKAEERAIQKALVETAYQHAPDEIIATLLAEMDADHIYLPTTVKDCWDERFGIALLEKAKELQVKGRNIVALLDEILAHEIPGSREFAESLLIHPIPTDYFERQRTVDVSDLLMKHSADAAWLVVWPLIQSDPDFGEALIEKQADVFRGSTEKNPPIPHRLTEDQLANLYVWLLRQFPPSEDIFISGVHSPSPRERVGQWRESVLTNLKNRGTSEACSAIERIAEQFPHFNWIRAQLLEAQAIHRRHSWKPPQPAEILERVFEQRKQPSLPQANSGYSDMDSRIQEIAEEILQTTPNMNGDHLNDFVIALGTLANFLRISLQEAAYKKGTKVKETQFHQNILRHLRVRLGEGVIEAPRQGGGPTDIKYRSVTIELKVEDKISDRRRMVEKYFSQPTQYSSADGAQLGILCILDLTTKEHPPAMPKNQISLETPPLHGFPNNSAPFPTKIATVFIDGNLRRPSDYSH